MCILCKTMGVTSLGPHTRPGCNLGHSRFLFCNKYVDLYTVCVFFMDFRGMRGDWGFNLSVPLVPRFYAVNKTMPRMWIHLLCVRVLFPMGSRELDAQIWALWRHFGHMGCMLDSDWLKKFLLRSDWSRPSVASITTGDLRSSRQLIEENTEDKTEAGVKNPQTLFYIVIVLLSPMVFR